MLSDRHCQLLTAYVDGELTARQRRSAERLLLQSPEARTFLEKLSSDSAELSRLPVRKAPEMLAATVMGTLQGAPTPALPVQPAALAARSAGISPWLGLALAACVLLTVGIGTYVIFGIFLADKPEDRQAQTPPEQQPPPEPVPVVAKGLDPLVGDLFGGAAEKFADNVEAKDVYLSLAVSQLKETAGKARLATALKREPAFRLDLPVANTAKAVARLQQAFKKNGITVLVDAAAKNNLAKAKKQAKNLSFVLYVENLKAEELSQILQYIAIEEAAGRQTERTIDTVAIKGMTGADRKDLSKLLKVAPKELEPGLIDWSPLIPAGPKTDTKAPVMSQPVERFAVVMAQGIKLNPESSKEIGQFKAARKGLRPDMLQVVLVIHEAAV